MPSARPHPLRTLFILSLSALAFALAQTTLIPALTELARSLHTDASGVAWTITGYTEAFLVGSGVALLAAITATLIPSRSGRMAHSTPVTQAA